MNIPTLEDFKRLEEKIDKLLNVSKTPAREIVDMDQAKTLLGGRSDNYLKGLIEKGKLQTAVKQGGLWLFDKSEILSLVPSYQSNQ